MILKNFLTYLQEEAIALNYLNILCLLDKKKNKDEKPIKILKIYV